MELGSRRGGVGYITAATLGIPLYLACGIKKNKVGKSNSLYQPAKPVPPAFRIA